MKVVSKPRQVNDWGAWSSSLMLQMIDYQSCVAKLNNKTSIGVSSDFQMEKNIQVIPFYCKLLK